MLEPAQVGIWNLNQVFCVNGMTQIAWTIPAALVRNWSQETQPGIEPDHNHVGCRHRKQQANGPFPQKAFEIPPDFKDLWILLELKWLSILPAVPELQVQTPRDKRDRMLQGDPILEQSKSISGWSAMFRRCWERKLIFPVLRMYGEASHFLSYAEAKPSLASPLAQVWVESSLNLSFSSTSSSNLLIGTCRLALIQRHFLIFLVSRGEMACKTHPC